MLDYSKASFGPFFSEKVLHIKAFTDLGSQQNVFLPNNTVTHSYSMRLCQGVYPRLDMLVKTGSVNLEKVVKPSLVMQKNKRQTLKSSIASKHTQECNPVCCIVIPGSPASKIQWCNET